VRRWQFDLFAEVVRSLVKRYSWQITLIVVAVVNLAVWLTQCSKPAIGPSNPVSFDSGAIVAVGIPDAATLADAVSPADVASPVTP